MTKLEASKGLGCYCHGCDNMFPSVDWDPVWSKPGVGCGKYINNIKCQGPVEPNWKDGIIPVFDEVEMDDSGRPVKSICPNCFRKWHYPANNGYVCEEKDCGFDSPCGNQIRLVSLDDVNPKPIPPGSRKVTLTSFSYTFGVPEKVTKVWDVRYSVRNPWRDEKLRKLNGLHQDIQGFVSSCKGTKAILNQSMIYSKTELHLAFGCAGGKHRSVAIAELVGAKYRDLGWDVTINHRDLDRPKKEKDGIDKQPKED